MHSAPRQGRIPVYILNVHDACAPRQCEDALCSATPGDARAPVLDRIAICGHDARAPRQCEDVPCSGAPGDARAPMEADASRDTADADRGQRI